MQGRAQVGRAHRRGRPTTGARHCVVEGSQRFRLQQDNDDVLTEHVAVVRTWNWCFEEFHLEKSLRLVVVHAHRRAGSVLGLQCRRHRRTSFAERILPERLQRGNATLLVMHGAASSLRHNRPTLKQKRQFTA